MFDPAARSPTQPPARRAPQPLVPWGFIEGGGSVLTAFAVYLTGSVALVLFAELVSKGAYDRNAVVFNIVGYQFLAVGTFLSATFFLVQRYHVSPATIGFRFPGWGTLSSAAFAVIPTFVAVTVFYAVFTTVFPQYHLQGNAKELIAGSTGHIGLAEKVLLFVFASIQAPLVEETLFRGILFQGLRESFSHRLPYRVAVFLGALISGTIFGLLHFQTQTLPVLVLLGVILAYIFQYGRSIYASAVVHGLFNAVSTIVVLQSV